MKKTTTKQLLTLLIIALTMITQISCSKDNPEPPTQVQSELRKITIEASNSERLDIIGSETTILTANGFNLYNKPIDIMGSVEWSVDNNNVSIDQNGLVTALKAGKSIVTATSNDISASYTVTVWDSSAPRTEIFISDAGNFNQPPWQILRTDDKGEYVEVFTKENLDWPQDIIVLEDQGIAIVSNLNSGKITKYDLKSGEYVGDFASGIGGPTRMKIGNDDLIYVLQWNAGLVLRYQQDGTFVDTFTDVPVARSIGIAWDTDNNLYVSSFMNAEVRKFDTSGTDLGLFINTDLQGPTNIWFEGNELYVNDYSQGIVKKFDSNGAYLGNFITGLNRPEGIDHLMNGNILIGNGGTKTIKEYKSDGTFIKDLIPGGTQNLLLPNAVIVREVNR